MYNIWIRIMHIVPWIFLITMIVFTNSFLSFLCELLPFCTPVRDSLKQNSKRSVSFSLGMHMYPFVLVQLIRVDLSIISEWDLGHDAVMYTENSFWKKNVVWELIVQILKFYYDLMFYLFYYSLVCIFPHDNCINILWFKLWSDLYIKI